MSEQADKVMFDAVGQTLENMAFMEVLPCEGDQDEAIEENCMVVDLLVHDPVQGEFRLLMPKNMVVKVAEAVFGMPQEELSDQLLVDILAEILNTVAGRYMTDVLEEEQAFKLGLPQVHMEGIEETDKPTREWRFCLDNEVLFVKIWGDF